MFLKAKGVGSDVTTFVTFGVDFTVNSILDLVSNVQSNCSETELQELVLYTHGVDGRWSVGSDSVDGVMTPSEIDTIKAKFGLLWPYFCTANGTGRPRLVLCVCEAGKNPDLLVGLATSIGQVVYACDGAVKPILGFGLGWWCGNTIEVKPEKGGSWNYVNGIPAPPIILS